MIKGIQKLAFIGMLTIAGGVYNSGGSLENSSRTEEDYSTKLNSFLNKQSELFIASDLEKKVGEERESFLESIKKPLYINPDLLNNYIKQAKKAAGKLPKEIDERLFRLMLKQESHYDAHIVSPTGYMGIGQVGYDVYKTFRSDKWESFKNPVTGMVDTLSVKREIFDPIINLELSIQSVRFFADYCKKNDPNWENKTAEEKTKEVLTCYNAGQSNFKEANWDPESKKLKKENRNYAKLIMAAYHDQSVKVKL
jgi:hypothetical protein